MKFTLCEAVPTLGTVFGAKNAKEPATLATPPESVAPDSVWPYVIEAAVGFVVIVGSNGPKALDVLNVCTRPHKFVDCVSVVNCAVGVLVFVVPTTATVFALATTARPFDHPKPLSR